MRKAILVCEATNKKRYENLCVQIKEVFYDKGVELSCLYIMEGESTEKYNSELRRKDVDYICSLDMSGFQMRTLLGKIAYNTFPAKQIHIIIDNEMMNLYGHHEMALNLYVFLPGDLKEWNGRYDHIPNLDVYQPFELDGKGFPARTSHNMGVLREIMEKVMQDVEGRI